jgi:hypothetical protein
MDRKVDRQTYILLDREKDTDGQIEWQTDEKKDELTNGCIDRDMGTYPETDCSLDSQMNILTDR